MKSAYDIAEAFRAAFAADSTFAAAHCEHEQTGNKNLRPALIFAVKTTPFDAKGNALKFTLSISSESSADRVLPTDPDPALAHAARVAAVRDKLLGAGAAALKSALNVNGSPFNFKGWSADPDDPALSERHFETPINVVGTVLIL